MTNPPKIEGGEGRAVNFPGETISIRDGRLRRALCRKTGPPGAGTNCERKKYITKYRKYHIKPHEKLLRFGPTLQKGVQVILSLSKRTRAVKHGGKMVHTAYLKRTILQDHANFKIWSQAPRDCTLYFYHTVLCH